MEIAEKLLPADRDTVLMALEMDKYRDMVRDNFKDDEGECDDK